jgi:hypothetical protein
MEARSCPKAPFGISVVETSISATTMLKSCLTGNKSEINEDKQLRST